MIPHLSQLSSVTYTHLDVSLEQALLKTQMMLPGSQPVKLHRPTFFSGLCPVKILENIHPSLFSI